MAQQNGGKPAITVLVGAEEDRVRETRAPTGTPFVIEANPNPRLDQREECAMAAQHVELEMIEGTSAELELLRPRGAGEKVAEGRMRGNTLTRRFAPPSPPSRERELELVQSFPRGR